MGIKPNEEYLNLEYFFQYMLALDMGEYSAATAMPSVRKSTLQTVKIIVPPRELQERFSCISKQSDKSKFALQNAISAARETKRSIIADALGIKGKE